MLKIDKEYEIELKGNIVKKYIKNMKSRNEHEAGGINTELIPTPILGIA